MLTHRHIQFELSREWGKFVSMYRVSIRIYINSRSFTIFYSLVETDFYREFINFSFRSSRERDKTKNKQETGVCSLHISHESIFYFSFFFFSSYCVSVDSDASVAFNSTVLYSFRFSFFLVSSLFTSLKCSAIKVFVLLFVFNEDKRSLKINNVKKVEHNCVEPSDIVFLLNINWRPRDISDNFS